MEFIKIVLLSICAAVIYGLLHDQITAHLCVEYFTIGHPPVFNTESPTLLAIGWGIIATWWVGLMLGIPMACTASFGARPIMTARELVRPLVNVLAITGVLAVIAGIIGYTFAKWGWVFLVEPMRSLVPADKHVFFLVDLWMHLASYLGGFVGGIVLCVWISKKRTRKAVAMSPLG